MKKRIVLFANSDWYLFNFRLPLIQEIQKSGCELWLISPAGPYAQKLVEMGLNWHPIQLDRSSINIFVEFKAIFQLRNFIKANKIDLVHGFTIKCSIYTALASLRLKVLNIFSITGMGYVFTSKDFKAKLLKPFLWTLLNISINKKNAHLIVQNKDDLNLFISSNLIEESRISLIPSSGVDCSRFIPTNATYNSSNLKVLLSARLLWDKGISTFVECAEMIIHERDDITFYLAGAIDKNNPASISIEQVNAWNNQGIINYLGHIDDMPNLLNKIDIAVLPSAREGLPKSLIEALACGIPIITTDVPGCREVVENGFDGILIQYGRPLELKQAIEFLISNPEKYNRFSKNARISALSKFDSKIVNKHTLEIYKSLFS
ncbi:glycosyltransferase family 4 protein [Gammaproteobacteria bacterium]|jgi:glycosyltransferase involved in cell wall biosynthesis|nr:glycosyltransferase family 4 protein [Gammaproteobacteria bacterium]